MPPNNIRQGKWSEAEHQKMFTFVKNHKKDIIEYLESNLIDKVRCNKRCFFIKMSKFIQTKTETQCKSRYQKQELKLLHSIKIPARLISKFEQSHGMQAIAAEHSEQILSAQPTEATMAESRLETSKSANYSIYTFKELREVLQHDFMPQIQNPTIKTQMEKFISVLPDDMDNCDEMPSFGQNSISALFPQINMSFVNSAYRPDSIFME